MQKIKGKPQSVQKLTIQQDIADWVNEGKTRKEIMALLTADGMGYGYARDIYYKTLNEMAPDTTLFDAYKKSLVEKNLERLEDIVEENITGTTAEKMIALKAIDQMSKLTGAYNDQTVTVAKNKEGEEIIQIKFS